MNLKSRQLRRGVAALAVVSALTACAKESDDKSSSTTASASPTPTGTPTTTPDQIQAFCDSLIALDTAIISLGPPEEEPEAAPTATSTAASASEGSESASEETAAPMSSATPMATEAPAESATAAPEAPGGPAFPDVATAMRPVADMLANTKTREIATAADTMVAILRQAVSTGDRDLLENEAYGAADAPLDAYGLQNCGYKGISTAAVDYEYDNLPSTAQAGKTTVTLKNDGKEFHEIVLLRINDGVTDSVDAIMDLPEGQIFSKVTPAFVTVVPPGLTGTGFTDLKAGKYIVLCFIPKGAEPGKIPADDAPPHHAEGMLEELTVS